MSNLADAINEYISDLNKEFHTGRATEHSYRPYLKTLLEAFAADLMVTNEPRRIACGAPDYILTTKNDVPVGYVEAKDIGKSLDDKANQKQFARYKTELNNLFVTDYMEFRLYRFGELVTSISIAELKSGKTKASIEPHPLNFDAFIGIMKDFCAHRSMTIKSPEKLAKLMAGKARLLARVIENSLNSDEASKADSTLKEQMNAFKQILIHDINPKEFGDIYGQTIAYGMFAARLHDPTLETFTREEAATLIPKSNPFLRKLFQYIAGYDLDDRIIWIVNALAEIFRSTDVASLLKDFGKATRQNDPMIHFYETFLAEYDPALRKSRGVWYTPEPVVNFIVRAVDDILKTEFGLSAGLADTSKVKIKRVVQGTATKTGKDVMEEVEVHKVQVLDPAAGTGTFLAEVIKQIYKRFEGQQGVWSNYVEEHLIPRINGFEILMASYAMAHLKLDMLLRETGYVASAKEQRFNIFLTNALEEHHPETGSLFASWLATEANEANAVKRDTPVMVVLGNPPYSVSSSNKSEWIENLMKDYKKDLNERNIQPLSDDYIKFIRFGQYFIEKNGEGILAFISNNSFIDGLIHRQMRESLTNTFNKVYILDLHGSLKRQEKTLAGKSDDNVFDIQPGVSINIFIKNSNPNRDIYVYDILGERQIKYKFLIDQSLSSIKWAKIKISKESNNFKNIDKLIHEILKKYISLTDLMPFQTSGIKTHGDEYLTNYSKKELQKSVTENYNNIVYDANFEENYSYRPFDRRILYNKTDLLGRSREKTIYHLKKDNYGLILVRQSQAISTTLFDAVFISNNLTDTNMFRRGGPLIFPLYLYPEMGDQGTFDDQPKRTPNLNMEIVKEIEAKLGLGFVPEKEGSDPKKQFAPIDLLDYIYAVLHSPSYRKKYKEFLKIDFPRVPYPSDKKIFWQLVKLGGELRLIHLLESPVVEKFITKFPINGDNKITRSIHQKDFVVELCRTSTPLSDHDRPQQEQTGRLYINDEQYFDDVPVIAWEFYIGGYQPAQKWLKDRKGRKLDFNDISHYQKIIVALTETDRIMKEIDKIDFMEK